MIACLPVSDSAQSGRLSDLSTGAHAFRVRQLWVVREMLRTLDTVTIAGQQHLMEKVVAFVEGQIAQVAAGASGRNRAALDDLMAQLKVDARGLFPDSARFARHAESLIGLLVAVGGG